MSSSTQRRADVILRSVNFEQLIERLERLQDDGLPRGVLACERLLRCDDVASGRRKCTLVFDPFERAELCRAAGVDGFEEVREDQSKGMVAHHPD